MEKGLLIDTLFSKAKFQALVHVFFLYKEIGSRLFVLVACVCTCCKGKLKMKNNLITHLKLMFGISSFIPLKAPL